MLGNRIEINRMVVFNKDLYLSCLHINVCKKNTVTQISILVGLELNIRFLEIRKLLIDN